MKLLNFIKSFPAVKRRNENWEKASELVMEIAKGHQQIAEDAAVFKAIFCVSPIVMIVVGVLDGIIHDVNQMFEDYTGYKRQEAIGKTIQELGLYHDSSARELVVSEIMAKGVIKNKPLVFMMKGGDLRKGLLSSKLITKDGKQCLLSVVMDTTELEQLRDMKVDMNGGVGVL